MSDDELVDILCYACPHSWTREMDQQGFDPLLKNPTEVVDFMERFEQAEDFKGPKVDHDSKPAASENKKSKKAKTLSKASTASFMGKAATLRKSATL